MSQFKKDVARLAAFSLFATLLAVFTGACSVFGPVDFQSIGYYDLGTPANNPVPDTALGIENLRSNSSLNYKMLYRVNKSKLTLDDNNKWTQTPDAMLTRYLQLSLIGDSASTAPRLMLGGTLLLFEINLEDKNAELAIDYSIRNQDGKILKSSSARFSSEFKKKSPEDFAAAMSDAASKLAAHLRSELAEISKKEAANPPISPTLPIAPPLAPPAPAMIPATPTTPPPVIPAAPQPHDKPVPGKDKGSPPPEPKVLTEPAKESK